MSAKKQILLIGAHISVAGGMDLAFKRGESIGCTSMQIFTKSNRQWQAKPLDKEAIAAFKKAHKASFIKPVVVHSSYLINIGSPDKEIEKKSTDALAIELSRCNALGIPYLVFHPGSHIDGDEDACLKRITKNLDSIYKKDPGKTMILLETMAGQGTGVCYKFEQIAHIIKNATFKRKLGVCFDTCHAFAAGYDFRTKESYEKMWENFDQTIGLTKLKAIHINDSVKDLASRVDRHAEVGKGKLGLGAFKLIFNDPRFFDIPKILETPSDTLEAYRKNIDIIIELLTPKTRKILDIVESR